MKRRQRTIPLAQPDKHNAALAMPVPQEQSQEATAAYAIAAAIQQGMPGDMFCNLMHTMDPQTVETAASVTTAELMDWFKQDGQARNILNQVPGFGTFCEQFHRQAKLFFPTAASRPL